MNITHINELKAQLNRVQHIIAESEQAAARLTAEEAALTKKEEAAEGLFMRTGLEGDLAAIKADLAAMKARREETERRLRVANNERARVNGEIGDAHQLLNELKREKAEQLSEAIQAELKVHRARLIDAYGYLGLGINLNSLEFWKAFLYGVFDGPSEAEIDEATRNAEAAVDTAMAG